MLIVGLTGGIGAGKSSVARRLADRGAVIIDSDRLAREVVARGTDGLAEVVAAFGETVLGADGELDRPALGQKVFGDEPARRRLEAIIHPRVRAGAAEIVRTAADDAIVVNDVPLLVETGMGKTFHLVVVVMASAGTRVRRLGATRGMSAEEAHRRIAAQATDEQRRAAADVLIDNEGDEDALRAAVDRLWDDRLVPFERNVRLREIADPPEWPEEAARLIARIEHAVEGGVVRPAGPPGQLILQVADPGAGEVADSLARAGFPRRDGDRYGSADPRRPVDLRVVRAGGGD